MRILISLSAKQAGLLYHHTRADSALRILRSGVLELTASKGTFVEGKHSEKSYFASLTRSRYGEYHYREDGSNMWGIAQVMLTLDGESLSENNKIIPVDYWGNRGSTDPYLKRSKEVEERLVSNKHRIPILKHLTRVDIIVAGAYAVVSDGLFGEREVKVRLDSADRQAKFLGSLVLQLKLHHIPYGFYPSIEYWAKRRGEFSYFGKKEVFIPGKNEGQSYYRPYANLRSLMQALSDLPYEKLDKQGRDLCDQLARFPDDIASVLNDYNNEVKIDSRHPESHALAVKIARMLQRRGLNTREQIAQFLAQKSKDRKR